MDIKIQIICLTMSFLFGNVYYLLCLLNKHLLEKSNLIIKTIVTILLSVNSVVIYYIILYKINYGIFHIYFIIFIVLGYITQYFICKFCVNRKK